MAIAAVSQAQAVGTPSFAYSNGTVTNGGCRCQSGSTPFNIVEKNSFGHAQRLSKRQDATGNVTSAAALRLGYELEDEQPP
jgi:hypothetical protein